MLRKIYIEKITFYLYVNVKKNKIKLSLAIQQFYELVVNTNVK